MKKEKIVWKMYFRVEDPVAYIENHKPIFTDTFNPEEAVEKAFEYCDKNNYEFLKVSYDYAY